MGGGVTYHELHLVKFGGWGLGNEELCFDPVKLERSVCYLHGGVKEAVGHMSLEICRESSTGDMDSGNTS